MAMAAAVLRGARSALALRRPLLRSTLPKLRQPNLLRIGGGVAAAGLASVTAAYGLRGVVASCDSGSSSAEPWVAYVDAASGRTYYHNAEAQQTVWEKPASSQQEPPPAQRTPSAAAGSAAGSSEDSDEPPNSRLMTALTALRDWLGFLGAASSLFGRCTGIDEFFAAGLCCTGTSALAGAIVYVVGNPADKSSRAVRVAKLCGGVVSSVGGVLLVAVAVQSALVWGVLFLFPKWK